MPELPTPEFLMALDTGPLRARLASYAAEVQRLAAENARLREANARLASAWPEAVGGVWRDERRGVWHCCPASSTVETFTSKAEAVACVADQWEEVPGCPS